HDTEVSDVSTVGGAGSWVHPAEPRPMAHGLKPSGLTGLWLRNPTAEHLRDPTHETPFSPLWRVLASGGVGSVWVVHMVPSHRAANVVSKDVPWSPTATQASAAVHDTLASEP